MLIVEYLCLLAERHEGRTARMLNSTNAERHESIIVVGLCFVSLLMGLVAKIVREQLAWIEYWEPAEHVTSLIAPYVVQFKFP